MNLGQHPLPASQQKQALIPSLRCAALLCSALLSCPLFLHSRSSFFSSFFRFPLFLTLPLSLFLDPSILSACHTHSFSSSSFPVPSSPTDCTLVTLVFLRSGAVPGDDALDLLTACLRSSIIECLRLKVQVSVQAGGWQVPSKKEINNDYSQGDPRWRRTHSLPFCLTTSPTKEKEQREHCFFSPTLTTSIRVQESGLGHCLSPSHAPF
ncbi:hypothetical protein DTO271G3_6242 [Paecilomyces variotii]|nr:hypothetical protein DTO271G3_6242 [Paecilomyces variotii]